MRPNPSRTSSPEARRPVVELSTHVAAAGRCTHSRVVQCIANIITVCPEVCGFHYFESFEREDIGVAYRITQEGVRMLPAWLRRALCRSRQKAKRARLSAVGTSSA